MFLELNNFRGAMKVQVASRCPPGHQAMWQSEGDRPRGLILDIQTLLHGKDRRRAFDALRLAQGSVGALNGDVFGATFRVWASVVVRGSTRSRPQPNRVVLSQDVLPVEHPFHGTFFSPASVRRFSLKQQRRLLCTGGHGTEP
jgi:hypothetical protein